MVNKRKILVIANCQLSSIVDGVKAATGTPSAVTKIAAAKFDANNTDAYQKQIDEADLILTQPISGERFGILRTAEIKALGKEVGVFPNLHFDGFHPDITYVGTQGNRVQSPMGDYHSAIVLRSFLKGESIEQCRRNFNPKTYQELGYLDAYQQSRDRLNERLKNYRFDVNKLFDRLFALKEPFMYTVNHPRKQALFYLVDEIFEMLSLPKHSHYDKGMHLMHDHLMRNAIWPVYPAIASNLGIPQKPFLFRQPHDRHGDLLSLVQFIRRSYYLYSKVPRERLVPRGRNAAFFTNLNT